MKVVKKIPTEAKPDGSAYAAPFHKLYVSDERGKAEAVVDVHNDAIVRTLHFDSETGMPQYDPSHARSTSTCRIRTCWPSSILRPTKSSGDTPSAPARAITVWRWIRSTIALFLPAKATN